MTAPIKLYTLHQVPTEESAAFWEAVQSHSADYAVVDGPPARRIARALQAEDNATLGRQIRAATRCLAPCEASWHIVADHLRAHGHEWPAAIVDIIRARFEAAQATGAPTKPATTTGRTSRRLGPG